MNPITRLTAVRMKDDGWEKKGHLMIGICERSFDTLFFFKGWDGAVFRMVLLMVISSVFTMTLVYSLS